MFVCTLIIHLLKSLESTDRDKGTHHYTRKIKEQYSNLIQIRSRTKEKNQIVNIKSP